MKTLNCSSVVSEVRSGFEIRFDSSGNNNDLYLRHRGWTSSFKEIVNFAEQNNIKFTFAKRREDGSIADGYISGGDMVDYYGLDFKTKEEVDSLLFGLLESNIYKLNNDDLIILLDKAEKCADTADKKARLDRIISNQLQKSLQNNTTLVEIHNGIMGNILKKKRFVLCDDAAHIDYFSSKSQTLETLKELLKTNQKIFKNNLRIYNLAVQENNCLASNIYIVESWIAKIIRKFSEAFSGVTEEQAAINDRKATKIGKRATGITTADWATDLNEDSSQIAEIQKQSTELGNIFKENVSNEEDSLSFFEKLLQQFQVSPNDQDVNKIRNGAPAATVTYLAHEFLSGTYHDGDYASFCPPEERKQRPIIEVLESKLPNETKFQVIDYLVNTLNCSVNEKTKAYRLDTFQEINPLEYLLDSPDAYLYLEPLRPRYFAVETTTKQRILSYYGAESFTPEIEAMWCKSHPLGYALIDDQFYFVQNNKLEPINLKNPEKFKNLESLSYNDLRNKIDDNKFAKKQFRECIVLNNGLTEAQTKDADALVKIAKLLVDKGIAIQPATMRAAEQSPLIKAPEILQYISNKQARNKQDKFFQPSQSSDAKSLAPLPENKVTYTSGHGGSIPQ